MQNYSENAEAIILGNLLHDGEKITRISAMLKPEHFYVPVYGDLYRNLIEQWEATATISGHKAAMSVRQHPACEKLDELQFNAWVADLMMQGANGDKYDLIGTAHYVLELYAKRHLLTLNAALSAAIQTGDVKQIEAVKGQIERVNVAVAAPKKVTTQDQLREAYAKLNSPDQIMSTGFGIWDRIFGGLSKKSRYVIAAHAGAGKTAMAMNIAVNVAKQGKKVHYLLFEETAEKLWARVVAMTQDTPMHGFRQAGSTMNDAARDAFVGSWDELSKLQLIFHEAPKTLAEMIDLCGQCDLIVVDGVSNFPSPPEYTKVDKAGYVSDQCVKLSQHSGAAVLMLSHVNSDAVKAGPSLAGIYGGQAASFDPEGILEIRRDGEDNGNHMKVIHGLVLKNRYGEVGQRIKMAFDGSKMKFYDYA
jgi:replicative DNA helicase